MVVIVMDIVRGDNVILHHNGVEIKPTNIYVIDPCFLRITQEVAVDRLRSMNLTSIDGNVLIQILPDRSGGDVIEILIPEMIDAKDRLLYFGNKSRDTYNLTIKCKTPDYDDEYYNWLSELQRPTSPNSSFINHTGRGKGGRVKRRQMFGNLRNMSNGKHSYKRK